MQFDEVQSPGNIVDQLLENDLEVREKHPFLAVVNNEDPPGFSVPQNGQDAPRAKAERAGPVLPEGCSGKGLVELGDPRPESQSDGAPSFGKVVPDREPDPLQKFPLSGGGKNPDPSVLIRSSDAGQLKIPCPDTKLAQLSQKGFLLGLGGNGLVGPGQHEIEARNTGVSFLEMVPFADIHDRPDHRVCPRERVNGEVDKKLLPLPAASRNVGKEDLLRRTGVFKSQDPLEVAFSQQKWMNGSPAQITILIPEDLEETGVRHPEPVPPDKGDSRQCIVQKSLLEGGHLLLGLADLDMVKTPGNDSGQLPEKILDLRPKGIGIPVINRKDSPGLPPLPNGKSRA